MLYRSQDSIDEIRNDLIKDIKESPDYDPGDFDELMKKSYEYKKDKILCMADLLRRINHFSSSEHGLMITPYGVRNYEEIFLLSEKYFKKSKLVAEDKMYNLFMKVQNVNLNKCVLVSDRSKIINDTRRTFRNIRTRFYDDIRSSLNFSLLLNNIDTSIPYYFVTDYFKEQLKFYNNNNNCYSSKCIEKLIFNIEEFDIEKCVIKEISCDNYEKVDEKMISSFEYITGKISTKESIEEEKEETVEPIKFISSQLQTLYDSSIIETHEKSIEFLKFMDTQVLPMFYNPEYHSMQDYQRKLLENLKVESSLLEKLLFKLKIGKEKIVYIRSTTTEYNVILDIALYYNFCIESKNIFDPNQSTFGRELKLPDYTINSNYEDNHNRCIITVYDLYHLFGVLIQITYNI